MTKLSDSTLVIWGQPHLTQEFLKHFGNHRLLKEVRYPCTSSGHLAAQLFLGAATGDISWDAALTGLHSSQGISNLVLLNRDGHFQCPSCQLLDEGRRCGQQDCLTPDCWRLLTGHDSIQWYSQRILDEIGLEASEANSQGGLRKLLLAAGAPCLLNARNMLSHYRTIQIEVTFSHIPLFCTSPESGQIFQSIWVAFDRAWSTEKSQRAPFPTAIAEAEAKETFAKREEFQLHILVAHPPQMALKNGPGANRDGAIILDGTVQDKAAIFFGPSTVRGALSGGSTSGIPHTVSLGRDEDDVSLEAPASAGAAPLSAVQDASIGPDKDLSNSLAWAAPAIKQAARRHAQSSHLASQPASQARAAHHTPAWAESHALETTAPAIPQRSHSTGSADLQTAHAAVSAKRTTDPKTSILSGCERQSSPSSYAMPQHLVNSTRSAGLRLTSRIRAKVALPRRAHPQSAFRAVVPSSQASIPIRPIACAPQPKFMPLPLAYLPRTPSLCEHAIEAHLSPADGRPNQLCTSPTFHSQPCSAQGVACLSGGQRITADISACPQADAEPQIVPGHCSQQALPGMNARAPSMVPESEGYTPVSQGYRPQPQSYRPCQPQPYSRNVSLPPGSSSSLRDLIQGLHSLNGAGPWPPPSIMLQGLASQPPAPSPFAASRKRRLEDFRAREPEGLPSTPALADDVIVTETSAAPALMPSPAQPACKRGRPKGSKNGSSAMSKAPHSLQAAEGTTAFSPSDQSLSPPARRRGRPKGSKNCAFKSPALRHASLNKTGAAAQPQAAAGEASPGSQLPRKRGRPKGSRNAPLGVQLVAPMKRRPFGPLPRPDKAGSPQTKQASQVLEQLSYTRGAVIDSNGGVMPDGSAGSTILELCKAVLTGGEDGAQASLQLAALTLEGIQAKIRPQAELGVQSNAILDPLHNVQRPLTPDCLPAYLPLARPAPGTTQGLSSPPSPCKPATELLADAQVPAPFKTAPEMTFIAQASTQTLLEQEAGAGQVDKADLQGSASSHATVNEAPATAFEEVPHGGPIASSQQLSILVAELTEQLQTAKNNLLGWTGGPGAQRALNASLALHVRQEQAIETRHTISAPSLPSEEPFVQQAACTTSTLTGTLAPALHASQAQERASRQTLSLQSLPGEEAIAEQAAATRSGPRDTSLLPHLSHASASSYPGAGRYAEKCNAGQQADAGAAPGSAGPDKEGGRIAEGAAVDSGSSTPAAKTRGVPGISQGVQAAEKGFSSPEIGEDGQGALASALDTVGKLCKDLSPIHVHTPTSNMTEPIKAVIADPQAAAMLV